MIHGIIWLYVHIIHFLVHKLFPHFPGPICLSGSLNLQNNSFSPNRHHPFLRYVHITMDTFQDSMMITGSMFTAFSTVLGIAQAISTERPTFGGGMVKQITFPPSPSG